MNWGPLKPLKVWRFGTGQDECLIHNAIIMLCFFLNPSHVLLLVSLFLGNVLGNLKKNNDQQPPEKDMM